MKSRSLSLLVVVIFGLTALPAGAQATLVFTRNANHPAVFAANDNGREARRIGPGYAPKVTPDGQSVVYLREGPREGSGEASEMALAPTAGGASRILMRNWREPFDLAFSPDSTTIAALRGGAVGSRKLVLIDIATGAQRVVASGFFSGLSFSPDGSELVYARSSREAFPSRSDLFRVATGGGRPVAITHSHDAETPLWGPRHKIVFVRLLGAKTRRYGPKSELFLIDPDGSGMRQLTHTTVGPLLFGLSPTDWSANGRRLLAEFTGEDTSFGVTVNPRKGDQRTLVGGDSEEGFVGSALSSNGKLVLGSSGGLESSPHPKVEIVPYSGGKAKVIVRNAYEPDWNR